MEELPDPRSGPAAPPAWTLVAHSRNVLKSWESLCRHTPQDARRCFAWLSENAMRPIPRRCYPLMGKANAGCWGYEIGAGNRVYYKPDVTAKRAVIYYAGPHPRAVPPPPAGV